MPVGELFLSAFLQVLFDRLASRELLQFLRQEGLYSKIKKWEETLEMIQVVLGDAEDKQLKDTAVKKWLDKLQDLAYDAEDMLDEFATEAFARKLKMEQHQQASTSKVRNLLPARFNNWSPRAVKFNIHMRSEIKKVTSRFEVLRELRDSLGLEKITGGTSSNAVPQRLPTTSVPTEPAVHGRDVDKAKILEMVLKNEPTDASFRVIPIVGMGGIGKTTLAQQVYNDKAVDSFEVKAWVCVSDEFDVLRISKAILESITAGSSSELLRISKAIPESITAGSSSELLRISKAIPESITAGSSSKLKELDAVQIKLKEKITGRKFLLVLDDVWSKDYSKWEKLKSPFMAGAPCSRIIVTTRLGEVALKMRPSGFYQLNLLVYEDCWLVFRMHAFENGNIPTDRNIELIRQKVVEKSKGLPLAAKTLGGLLRSKQTEDEWLEILNSEIWELLEEDGNEIPTALKLSYRHLPSQLKRCFAYCAIFPKDYKFQEEELVLLWMAEGLLQPSTDRKQPEDLGAEYVNDLFSRSLFQQSNSNSSTFVMHDLVHDLAQWAFGEISLRLDNEMGANQKQRVWEKVRHFSYTVDRFDGKNKFEVFLEAVSLKASIRTFLAISQDENSPAISQDENFREKYITNMILFDMLPKLKTLRALSLRTYHIIELPNSIGSLKLLRYLNLAYTEIRSLPESTTSLYNLQSLLLTGCCKLKKLPSNLRNLTNLRHLDIRGARSIAEMPVGMKELKSLQKLSDFILGKNTGSTLKDLKSLEFLHGELCISRLNNVIDCGPRDLVLRDKKNLKELSLEWESEFDVSRNAVGEETVLDMLRPHQNLQKLTITCYGGTRFPPWVGDPSFSKMTVLRLERCENCTSLPSFGLLSSLKDLTIEGMKKLKILGSEIYGVGCSDPFQSLEILYLRDLQELEHWEPIKENEHVGTFPCLRNLSIVRCPKVSGRLPDRLPSLEKLEIKNCEQLVVSFSSLPKLCELAIDGCKEMTSNSPTDLKSLKSLTLAGISGFGNWLRQQNFISITELQIENCSNFVSFPEVCFLLNLSSLEIINCNALTSLPTGMNDKNACLGSLKMKNCNSLTFIVRGKLPSSLKKLEIEDCEKLEYLWDDNEESSTSVVDEENPINTNISLLEYLHVKNCPSLKCLSSSGHLPQTLRTLSLEFLDLESIVESFQNNKSLEEISVRSCWYLKSVPIGLHNLIHLRKVLIYDCESIECLAEEGLPNTNLSECLAEEGLPNTNLSELEIYVCGGLKALPSWFHSLNSLKSLTLNYCPSMTSFPEEGFPTNLTYLFISGLNVKIYKAVLKWGLHNLTSLTSLLIWGHPEAESFPQQEVEMTFPPTLTHLDISSFPNLKCLMGEGFRNLNSLESLTIDGCPNLTSFPEIALPSSLKSLEIRNCQNFKSFSKLGLPSSLSKLEISDCPEVRSFPEQGLPSSLLELDIKRCPKLKEDYRRTEWSKISHICKVEIDYRRIYEFV